MKSKKYIGIFCGWENMDLWQVLDPATGKPVYFTPKRRYKYRTPYILFIKRNKVVKTKRLRPKKFPRTEIQKIIKRIADSI